MSCLLNLSASLLLTLKVSPRSSNSQPSDTCPKATSTFADIRLLLWKVTSWLFWMRNVMIYSDFLGPG